MDPYTDADPEYRSTPLHFRVPPPSVYTCPQPGRHPGAQQYSNQPPHQPRQIPSNMSHPTQNRSYNNEGMRDGRRPLPPQQRNPQHHSTEATRDKAPVYQQQQPSQQAGQKVQVDVRQRVEFLEGGRGMGSQKLRMVVGEKPETVDFDLFSMGAVMTRLMEMKKKLVGVPHELVTAARSRANPYERVSNSLFINRAAVKLAYLDVLCNLTGSPVSSAGVFRFADLCGGPGGFSEYVLWRKRTSGEAVKGWGISLKTGKGEDWALDKFHPDTDVENSFSVCDGVDGSGDLLKEQNIREFARLIDQATDGNGVDLVTADGGLCFEGKEQDQEWLMRRLLLCQIISMLLILRRGGVFVCKLFDISLPFTAGLVYILHSIFDRITIVKPLPSRPANAERYAVCHGNREKNPIELVDYLLKVNVTMERGEEVVGIVDLEEMQKDEAFLDYLQALNMKIAVGQTNSIQEMLKHVENPELGPSVNQEEVRRQCFKEWRLPVDEVRHIKFAPGLSANT
ncbi:uncharacterized protein VTP21DRAFT_5729 [Calcarisporiella thermophila]|uniref:uncharacterized protein n=1 Tax=Calcarisporiella thermophila TaxID=911321 RepID=UPI0037429543